MAKVKHAVVRTDLMDGTDVRADLVSIKYIVSSTKDGKTVKTPTEIDNGNVLKVGALMEGEREIYEGSNVAAGDGLKDIVLLAAPEVMYDERLNSLDDYFNEADKPIRGYRLDAGQIFSVTKEALAGKEKPAVGDAVELAAGTKLNVASSATQGSTQVGTIIAIDVVGRFTYYAIRVDAIA